MSDDRDVVAHLAECFDAVYEALGELAPLLTFDSYVVCAHEMSRSFGEVALSMREYTGRSPKPLGIVDAVLRQSWQEDPSGTLTLYAVAVLVGPRLLVNQAHDMQEFRASQQSVLDSYDWVDRDHGVVRIPIERAIDLLAERGMPTNGLTQGELP